MARIIGKGIDFEDVLIVPKYNKVLSRKDVNFETQVTRNYRINIPFISANMDTITEAEMAIAMGKFGGLGVIHRFMDIEEQARQIGLTRLSFPARLKHSDKLEGITAAAIGVKDYEERAAALVDAKVDVLVIDIAHGHSKYAGKVLDYLKKTYPSVDIIAGNIATKDAAEYFLSKGADAVKVGIGPGKVCTTRVMAGAGVHQLTAIIDVYEATQGRIPILADGGIKEPGDAVKAFGAGANVVMCGYIFRGCNEVPERGRKLYRGSASEGVKGEAAFVEGREINVEEGRGPVKDVIDIYLQGLASGMTYVGAKSLDNLIGKADFIYR